MRQWRVILLAALAVSLLTSGLLALVLPESYEGRVLYRLDEQHALRTLDAAGVVLLILGWIAAGAAAALWQRRMNAAP